MALYADLASLSQTASSNAADGTTDAPSTIDNNMNLLASFIAQLRDGNGFTAALADRNLLVNSTGANNQRLYVSAAATTVANQVTLDRWRVVVLGQNLTFGAAAPDRTMTAPAGGVEQIIGAEWVEGGVYTLSWTGTATAKVNGVAILSGASTAALPANTAITVQFASGTFTRPQFELGAAATPYYRRPPDLDFSLCQRYFTKSYAQTVALGTATAVSADQGYGAIGGSIVTKIEFPVVMRTVPTVYLWSNNGVANQWVAITTGGSATSYAASVTNISDRNASVVVVPGAGEVFATGQWAADTGF